VLRWIGWIGDMLFWALLGDVVWACLMSDVGLDVCSDS